MIVVVKIPKNGPLLCHADLSCKFMQKAHDSIRKHIEKHVTSTTCVRIFLYTFQSYSASSSTFSFGKGDKLPVEFNPIISYRAFSIHVPDRV